ncbi:MAG TPA: preprotein translocase subunit SecE [Streptosporangiaceae bacterium]|jgi:preprotein translocase subunit SecE|nr:preprotein translocase subunit SecE [Streptosporangiaceae bacterium]
MATGTDNKPAKEDKGRPRRRWPNPALFVRQVIAELRKVIWPTRKNLINYTVVTLIFVLIMVGIVSALDFGLTKAVFAVFT